MLPLKLLRFIADWSSRNPAGLVWIFVAVYVLWVVVRAGLSARKRAAIIPENKIDELRFDYLPDSPLSHGWVVAYAKEPVAAEKWKSAKWSPALNAPIPGSMHMEVDAGCAIENLLDSNKQQADWLRYAAKHTNETMVFTYVRLEHPDGCVDSRRIKRVVGTGKAHPTRKWESTEWTLHLKGVPIGGGWRQFDVSLPKSVEDTRLIPSWRSATSNSCFFLTHSKRT
jgi:hypothetical protein